MTGKVNNIIAEQDEKQALLVWPWLSQRDGFAIN
jgi:hypothetical protein